MFRAAPRILRSSAALEKAATFSVARILSKGIIYGGLGGGLLGLAIELSPEEAGLRSKAMELAKWASSIMHILEGKELEPPGPPPPAPPSVTIPKVEVIIPPKKEESESPVVVTVGSDAPAQQPPQEEQKTDTPSQPDTPPPPTPSNDPQPDSPVESEAEPVPEGIPSSDPSPDRYDDPPGDVVVGETASTQTVDDPDPSAELHNQIATLQKELASLQSEIELQQQRQAGTDQATIETMDRLFGERERAISLAKQSIAVLTLIEDVARDEKGLSAGALRVDFDRATPKMVRACFTPENPTMVTSLLGNVLAALYSVEAGLEGQDTSVTRKRLAAVHRARESVREGKFLDACTQLHAIENVSADAKIWTDKALTAAQVQHSASAAIAHMYDDLSRII